MAIWGRCPAPMGGAGHRWCVGSVWVQWSLSVVAMVRRVWRGAGMTENGPLMLSQIAWLKVSMSMRSSWARGCRADSAAIGAVGGLSTFPAAAGRWAVYGVVSGSRPNAPDIGVA